MKALVTGGSGFIGSHIVDELVKLKWDVTIYDVVAPMDIDKAKFLYGDVVNFSLPKLNKYDVIFHCAGMVGTETLFAQPYRAEAVNVLGTIAILDWVRRQPNEPIVVQTNLLGDWANPYMMTKNQGEQYGLMYHKQWGVNYVSVKPTDVYGPRQSTTQKKAAPTFIVAAIDGSPLPIYGDGQSWVNYIYAGDVALCCIGAAKKKYVGQVINLSHPDNDMSTLDFAKRVLSRVWKTNPLREECFGGDTDKAMQFLPMRPGQPGTIGKIEHDTSLAREILNFDELMGLDEGLDIAINWYQERMQ